MFVFRCEGEQYRQPGVRYVNPQTDNPALPESADGASQDHPVRPERHGKDVPRQQTGTLHHQQERAGRERVQPCLLQRGPEIQQGESNA